MTAARYHGAIAHASIRTCFRCLSAGTTRVPVGHLAGPSRFARPPAALQLMGRSEQRAGEVRMPSQPVLGNLHARTVSAEGKGDLGRTEPRKKPVGSPAVSVWLGPTRCLLRSSSRSPLFALPGFALRGLWRGPLVETSIAPASVVSPPRSQRSTAHKAITWGMNFWNAHESSCLGHNFQLWP